MRRDTGIAQRRVREFRRLFDDRQYEQALVPARQVVTLTEQEGSGDELQVAIMNLAATQSLAEELQRRRSELRVIELIEAEGTRASSRLARANAGLAVVYHDAGRHEMAVARFEARSRSHAAPRGCSTRRSCR